MIAYPSNLKTKQEKLFALYPLQRIILSKYNEEGERYRTDIEKYRNKWYPFAQRPPRLGGRTFHKLRLPIFREINRLRTELLYENYPDRKEWHSIDLPEKESLLKALWGDRAYLAKLPINTSLQCQDLEFIKGITLDGITDFVPPPDPFEDPSGFTEVDPATYLSQSATRSTVTSLPSNLSAYLWNDYGVGHFGDFEHLLTTNLTVEDLNAEQGLYSVGDAYGTLLTMLGANDSIGYFFTHWNANPYISYKLYDYTDDGLDSYTDSSFRTLYHTIGRTSTSGTIDIFSDADRLVSVDTLTLTVSSDTYRYLQLAYSKGYGTAYASTNYQENLDLQEAAGGWSNIAKAGGVASAAMAKINGAAVADIAKLNGTAV